MTKLTHKVRNPKKLDTWLDIWTADNITVNNDTVNYTITPSNKWKIPIAQLSKTNNDVIPIDYINNGKNIVTTTNPENTTSGLAYFNSYNVVKAIDADRGLSFKTENNKTTIGHENNLITGATIGPTSSNKPSNSTKGTSVYIPFFTYDNHGHITEGNNITYTVEDLTIKNLSNEFTPATGEGQNATPGKNFNKTVVDIIGNSINNLLPINSADNNGIVLAGNDNESSIWATASITENNQTKNKPAWRKITNEMIDANAQISGDKIIQNSANSPGVIPAPESSSGPQFWGVPSDTYDQAKAGNFNSNTTYYTLENNGEYKKVEPQLTETDFNQNPTKYYYIPEKSPQWSSLTLSAKPLSITYNMSTSTLQIGISDKEIWEETMIQNPKNESEQISVPSSWSNYVVKAVDYTLS